MGAGPEAPGDGPGGRGVDVAIWVAVIAALVSLSAGAAWLLSQFEIREITSPVPAEKKLIPVEAAPPSTSPETEALPAPVAPLTRGPNGETVRRPAWVRQPIPFYPELAMRRGIEQGVVQLRCETFATGEFGACEVLNETPKDAGFAGAALAAMREARVEPPSIDGFATDGEVAFAIRFRTAPEP